MQYTFSAIKNTWLLSSFETTMKLGQGVMVEAGVGWGLGVLGGG